MLRPTRPAYTLFEMVLVLALLIVLVAIAYPSIDAMGWNMKVTAGTDAVRAGWASARAHAVNEGQPYRFSVYPGKGNYRIAPDSNDYWSSSDTPVPADPANPPLVIEAALPAGISFSTPDTPQGGGDSNDTFLPPDTVDPNSLITVAVFLPTGEAREDAAITLQARGARQVQVRLRALTGAVTVKSLDAGGN